MTLTEVDDSALMRLVADGDAAAYTRLVRAYAPLVFGVACHMLGRTGEAEEVTQEVFLKLWQRPDYWRPAQGRLGAWLRRVTANAALDLLRRRRRDGGGLDENLPDSTPDAVAQLAAQEEQAALRHAITALPERQRVALMLVTFHEMSQAEAAAALALHVDAFESLLARARRRLRDRLRPLVQQQGGSHERQRLR